MDEQRPESPAQSSKQQPYEKPLFEEQKEMVFPEEVWEEFSNGAWCFGCTNCNCN
jgi:hypothetical protein